MIRLAICAALLCVASLPAQTSGFGGLGIGIQADGFAVEMRYGEPVLIVITTGSPVEFNCYQSQVELVPLETLAIATRPCEVGSRLVLFDSVGGDAHHSMGEITRMGLNGPMRVSGFTIPTSSYQGIGNYWMGGCMLCGSSVLNPIGVCGSPAVFGAFPMTAVVFRVRLRT